MWMKGAAIFLLIAGAFLLRYVWPESDPAPRLSWSNEVYTDPAVMVHAARNKVLYGQWVLDYNRDYYVFPLMNWLTWIFFEILEPGRKATLLLSALAGTFTIAAIGWGLGISRGLRAALLGLGLGGACYWLAMYSRIPIAENVVGMLLAFACVAALSRDAKRLALAGALGVFATLFGKMHAVGFLPGLVAFVAMRDRSRRSVLAVVAGGTVVFLLWLFFLFLPHRELITEHVQRQSTGMHGPLPFTLSLADGFGEILNTLRRSWVFYRMPVEGILGSLFAFWTLGNNAARRERLQDGTAIWAFWFISIWLYYSLLPYKGPRYFVLVAPALVAGAAAQIDRLLSMKSVRLRPPQRFDEHIPLVLWLYSFFFGAIDGVKHYVSMWLEWVTNPPARISEHLYNSIVSVFSKVDTFRQNLAWAAVLLLIAYAFVLWHPEMLRSARKKGVELSAQFFRRCAVSAVVVSLAFAFFQYSWWAAHRTRFIEDIKKSVPHIVGANAIMLGPLAPLLTQDTRIRSLPYYGPPGEKGLLEKYKVTHVVVCGPGDAKQLEERYPAVMSDLQIVQAWPLRTLFASTLEIYRVPQNLKGVPIHDYQPTTFERAAEAIDHQQWQEGLDIFSQLRSQGGAVIPEVLSLEAVSSFKLGDLAQARKLLEQAIRERPMDPLNYQNLGVIELREGDRQAAIRHWIAALKIDPSNEELEKQIKELLR